VTQRDLVYLFGALESDPIAIDAESGEVLWCYWHDMAVIGKCAVDGAHFLDAIFEIVRLSAEDLEDAGVVQAYVERAIAMAGGEQYRPFFEAVI